MLNRSSLVVEHNFCFIYSFSDLFACWTVGFVMSGRVKSRQSGSNAALEQATLSVNERILKECHTLYTDPDKGTIFEFDRNIKSIRVQGKKIQLIVLCSGYRRIPVDDVKKDY